MFEVGKTRRENFHFKLFLDSETRRLSHTKKINLSYKIV